VKINKKERKGQVAIFVIISIMIVAVLLVVFLPGIGKIFSTPVPDVELTSCVEESVIESLGIIMAKGGSLEPELYYNYLGESFEYICYTNAWYETCVMQKPLFKNSIEAEVEAYVQPIVAGCVNNLVDRLESKGYTVQKSGTQELEVNIIPENIGISIDLDINVEKDGSTQTYDKFNSDIKSSAYEMIIMAAAIANWEAHYGDAPADTFMNYYPDKKVEKKKQSDGTTIYTITDRDTGEKLGFASRSMAWPPGYAI